MLRTLLFLIVVCAPSMAQEARLLRVYDIGSLSARPLRGDERPDREGKDGEFSLLGPITAPGGEEEWHWDPKGKRRAKASTVAQAVVELIRAYADDVVISQSSSQLMVTTTLERHKQVAKVIEALHRGGGDVVIAVRHIVLRDKIDAGTAGLLKSAAAGTLDDAGAARLGAGAARVRTGTLRGPQGRWAFFRSVREHRYVPDWDVEIAQASAIADPQPQVALDGLKVAARPFSLRGGGVLVRVVASAGEIVGIEQFDLEIAERNDTLRIRTTDFGKVDQADYRGVGVSTDAVLRDGRWHGFFAGSDAARRELVLMKVVQSPKAVRAGSFMALSTGALTASDRTWVLQAAYNGEPQLASINGTPRLDIGGLQERLNALLVDDNATLVHASWLHGGSLILHARPRAAVPVLDRLAILERALIRPVRLEVRILAADRVVGEVFGSALVDRPASIFGYRRLDFVGDYEVEVAQESRIGDPKASAAYAGVVANFLAQSAGTNTYRLQLDLTASSMPEKARVMKHGVGGVGLVQAVDVKRVRLVSRVELTAGTPLRVDLGDNPYGDGSLVAVITVSDR